MSLQITLFTPEEATAVAQKLRPELERLAKLHHDIEQLMVSAEVLDLTVSAGGSESSPEALELAETRDSIVKLGAELAAGADAVHRHGCLLKDIPQGLVDFYSLSGDRLVFLCWKRDEPEVAHWHSLESGFSGRQRLDTSELE